LSEHATPTSGSFAVPVEAGAILQFCRAIGETDPIHHEVAAARRAGFRDLVAPPTFLMVADHYDPAFPRRPRPGRPWPDDEDPAQLEGLFHVEQRFTWARHPSAGDVLTAFRAEPRTWERQGRRGGRLEFIETVTEFVDDLGPVATTAWIDVRTEVSHAAISSTQPAATEPTPPGPDDPPGIVLVEGLTRTQIVMYVAAAGDFHPLHHDDVYAREHGYPGVFAPGMLTLALTARSITECVGLGALAWMTSRFRAQVWPGDTLVARVVEHLDVDPGEAVVTVTTVNQHGTTVLETQAGLSESADQPDAEPGP
jgi:acyl dehydratase